MKQASQVSLSKELRDTIQFIEATLTVICVWPIPYTSLRFLNHLKWILVPICQFLLLLTIIPCNLYLIIKAQNFRMQLKMLAPAGFAGFQMLKYMILVNRKNKLQKLLHDVSKDWLSVTKENRLIFQAKAKIARRVTIMMAMSMYSGGLGYRVVLPLLKRTITLPNNITLRLLPCTGYFPFIDVQVSPTFEILFVLQVLAGMVAYTIQIGTTGMLSLFFFHAASLLRMLANKLIELNNEKNVSETNVQKKIVEIVTYQDKIKRFLYDVEQLTHDLCFMDIVNNAINICALGYCLIAEWEDSNASAIIVYTILLVPTVISMFAICYIGQLLLDESEVVRETTITMDWYRFPVRNAKCLIIMIIKNNHPINLRAAKVITVSLATFTDIMKLSLTYLNMFREIT